MTADIELLPLPEPYGYLRELDGGLQMSIGPVRPADRAGGYATPWAAMYDPGRVRANVAHATAAKDAEIERLRAERDSFQRVGIAAQARAERMAEALRRQRGWWLASKGEAVSNAPGGLTRIDPGFIALCDAHVQQIDLALHNHDQEVGNE